MNEVAKEVVFAWDHYAESNTPVQQAYALQRLNNAIFDLKTWIPGFNSETGEIDE